MTSIKFKLKNQMVKHWEDQVTKELLTKVGPEGLSAHRVLSRDICTYVNALRSDGKVTEDQEEEAYDLINTTLTREVKSTIERNIMMLQKEKLEAEKSARSNGDTRDTAAHEVVKQLAKTQEATLYTFMAEVDRAKIFRKTTQDRSKESVRLQFINGAYAKSMTPEVMVLGFLSFCDELDRLMICSFLFDTTTNFTLQWNLFMLSKMEAARTYAWGATIMKMETLLLPAQFDEKFDRRNVEMVSAAADAVATGGGTKKIAPPAFARNQVAGAGHVPVEMMQDGSWGANTLEIEEAFQGLTRRVGALESAGPKTSYQAQRGRPWLPPAEYAALKQRQQQQQYHRGASAHGPRRGPRGGEEAKPLNE